ncbi:hypothetical protein MA5S0422_2432 [Mycobacteroides abscessus 5S-0422]|uniref:Transmembrane protein n=1 Tax=Mycobacteroides abscessus subsp. bolletii 1513 TaxID=1299321 RepID=X8DQS1_9MYCO|nr:hypothetical protein [Mycobacteroides abscessus]EUA70391.1 hypothetical protein I540_2617 [Mycobacteroides abscessus subsp. bolletii 1513]EIU12472.1 hypothetical protein MA5S0304_1498 [Mycobacteroides abscessus 5S-0304]EIU14266.1 hypothetical protein MA5S0421_1750 [Mycobacteroides abscessus 5S-0421]EIU14929.1 hypothetical protein MA5S0422_2432 [Mycobacteroides abscessus 5S-0422]EIU27041.1 hypothetical protein MA5S0708_1974 [Mycobacteroides abscessus 5S-0708]
MIVIVGLVALLVAGIAGVLSNAGSDHVLTVSFSVFGYYVTGSTGTLFVWGLVAGMVAMLGLNVLLAGAWRTAGRGQGARNELARARREAAFLNQERDRRLEHDEASAATASTVSRPRAAAGHKGHGRWRRQSMPAAPVGTASWPDRVDTASPRLRAMNTENLGVRHEHR